MTLLAVALACTPDSDGDGLDDRTEREIGTNPVRADSDEDGLDDGAELLLHTDPWDPDTDGDALVDGLEEAYGTDPTTPDADGDGYLDGWEAIEGSIPTDERSLIYTGRWPYNPEKDAVDGVFPRWKGNDQFGDLVDVYDFAGSDRVIVQFIPNGDLTIHVALIEWLGGGSAPQYGLDSSIPGAVQDGALSWIAVLLDGGSAGWWGSNWPVSGLAYVEDPDGVARDQAWRPFGGPYLLELDSAFDVVAAGGAELLLAGDVSR
jgi:hypothetical protein